MDLGDAKYTVGLEDKASAKMADIGKAVTKMGDDTKKASAKANESLTTLNTTVGRLGLAMAGLGLLVGGLSVKAAGDFDSAMREVNTMMLLSEEAFADFKNEVRDMAKELGVSAVESARALYQAISAGVPKENVIEFLAIATKAAIGGVTDTETAVDGLTTVINAFKLNISDAQHVADVMFTTVKGGKTTFPELAKAMSIAAPMAATLGIKFEEMLALVATLTKQGVPTERAFTQLRAAMVSLATPTAEMANLLGKLDYESGQALIDAKGLQGALEAVNQAAEGNAQAIGLAMGSVEALSGALGVTGANSRAATKDIEGMTTATGSATEAFNQMEETAGRQFDKLKSQVTDLAIALGEALMPYLITFLDNLTIAVARVGEWADEHPKLVDGIGKAVIALIGAGGFLYAVTKIITVIITLRNALIAVQALSGPKGWALLALSVAAAAGGVYAFNKMMTPSGEEVPMGTPPVQSFAYGGIVPGSPGQPVPIMAHGGEQFLGVGNSAGGVTINVGTFVGNDSALRDFSRVIGDVLAQDGRRTSFAGVNTLGYMEGSSAP